MQIKAIRYNTNSQLDKKQIGFAQQLQTKNVNFANELLAQDFAQELRVPKRHFKSIIVSIQKAIENLNTQKSGKSV